MPLAYDYSSKPIIKRLIERFSLQETPIDPNQVLIVLKTIQMVTNVDELLKDLKIGVEAKDISAASGWTTYHPVPKGKRWKVKFLQWEGTTGASQVVISDGTNRLQLAAGTAAFRENWELPMSEDWELQAANTNDGADTSINMSILYEEEDAYEV